MRMAPSRYGETVQINPRATEMTVKNYEIHPEDTSTPFYELRLNYSTKDLLQVKGKIPCKFSRISRNSLPCSWHMSVVVEVQEGEPGENINNAIEVDDDGEGADEQPAAIPLHDRAREALQVSRLRQG
jgi:hypothetical protein